MQRTFVLHARVRGIRVLQNFVAENNFLPRRGNLGQPFPSHDQNLSRAEIRYRIKVELNTKLWRNDTVWDFDRSINATIIG
jgi:hypothetical protein